MSSQISLFEKVQSDFLGLEGTATCDELLELEALHRQSVQSPPFKEAEYTRGWKSPRKLSYDAWKQVVDEGVTPEAAKVKYANTVQMLKRKYGSKVNETERSRYCSGVITGSPRTKNSTTQEAKSSGSREYNSKTLNPDPIPQDTTGNSNLATLTSPQQSSTSPGAPAITSSNQTSITNNVLIPDRKPSAEPTGIYYDGTCYYCVVCELRLETCRCDDSLLL